ncbi:MAG: pirin family protein [Zymomonas mobilis subsp. pomaceae]|uniref:Pirin domain protein n=1 Tax=Zymomonas mobilis subsp. pomaceae (strain ATCC 29192 / DSM 22645 / JCM 10191 / CCUG 17912 / NBRC 13757 / NCIMB 11200 / NRRL B-4491 / Barker I) TaxID=579138 RepID=F8EVQ6_ZYMMT|nr:pirin family protein [Zymomonas mobilis]AEI38393.1 Pirin domain protein [Zymomonas mobilis subsp. pomaceae ATCC 29192]MDX5948083.1 pirin family protein [Zymomonas mobilis subsp. pomaceae]GEB89412.1 quercetin 2,3-dioxygenase [Zymomonas mobilis subsp. pomaceae]
MKKLLNFTSKTDSHWVGDGFPVQTLFSYRDHNAQFSPFLLLDFAGPVDFEPSQHQRGVGQHPHRGFETVTIVYEGEVAHRDSSGKGGVIGVGDVQWMTAGSGILHEEFHSEAFTKKGGRLQMIQLWVNLPAKDKMTSPHYQAIVKEKIPTVSLPENSGALRIIAGDYEGQKGAAKTFTPMDVWDVHIHQGKTVKLPLKEGRTTHLIAVKGLLRVNSETTLRQADVVTASAEGDSLSITAEEESTFLLLSGEPIKEEVVGYGPFVMNSQEEIKQAVRDFNSGHFGEIKN